MKVILTVTNDLSYDQRMHRIARTLVGAGYSVTLVGRVLKHSIALSSEVFQQHRIRCRAQKGFLFYAEYNIRLLAWLMRQPVDIIGSVDFDTLPAGALAGFLRGKKRVFDAHEYFTEVPELVGRPVPKLIWACIGRVFLRFYRHAYTVSPALAAIFTQKYKLPFAVVRNLPVVQKQEATAPFSEPKIILYQGALNEGRGLEAMLDALVHLQGIELWLAGEGDLSDTLRHRCTAAGLNDRVRFLGFVTPDALPALTRKAWIGINLLENRGLSYYYSLANKFFDYVQSGKPQIGMDFPEYRAHNALFEVAVLLQELSAAAILAAIGRLRDEPGFYQNLAKNCAYAARVWTWENEQETLLAVWQSAAVPR